MSGACSSMAGMGSVLMAVLVVVGMIVVVVIVMMVMPMLVGALVRALGRVCRDLGDKGRDVRLQPGESGGLLPGPLVEIKPPVHLDLKAVASRGGIRKSAHQLHTLVGVVDLHRI